MRTEKEIREARDYFKISLIRLKKERDRELMESNDPAPITNVGAIAFQEEFVDILTWVLEEGMTRFDKMLGHIEKEVKEKNGNGTKVRHL